MNNIHFNNILVVKHGSLGDIAFSLLAMDSIKKKFYNSKIDLLTEYKYQKFLTKSNYFINIIQDNRSGIFESLKIIFKIKKNNYDLIIDLQNSKRTNNYWSLLKFISKVKINGSRSNCDIRYIIPPQGSETPQRGLYNQLKLLGIDVISRDIDWLSTNVPEIKNNKIILMIPSVSKSGKHKQWSSYKYGKLARFLEEKGYDICIVGQESDKAAIKIIINFCTKVIDLTGKSPPEIIYSVAKNSDLIISNDTGPGHIAALSHSPILFLGINNVVSKSNLSEYKNGYRILNNSIDSLSLDYVIDFLNEKNLITK
tara:strand:+ start:5441 stop:6376 length:936 start_codon:yes stop_codon:yes gene_type:complete